MAKNKLDGEIIVSDSSKDGSDKIAEKEGTKVVKHNKEGYGIAVREGMRNARGDIIIYADADGTYSFKDIPHSAEREKRLLLAIVSEFFGFPHTPLDDQKINEELFFDLVKETVSDGLCFHVLSSRPPLLTAIRTRLIERVEAARAADQRLKEAFAEICLIPIPKILVKEGTYRFADDYMPGTRYGCDIDIYVDPKHLDHFDDEIRARGFVADGAELNYSKELLDLAYKINKDIMQSITFLQIVLPLIAALIAARSFYHIPSLIAQLKKLEAMEKQHCTLLQSRAKNTNALKKYLQAVRKNTKTIARWLDNAPAEEMRGKHNGLSPVLAEAAQKTIFKLKTFIEQWGHEEERMRPRFLSGLPTGPKLEVTLSAFQTKRDQFIIISDKVRDHLNRFLNCKQRIRQCLYTSDHPHYHYLNGAFIDIQQRLLYPNIPFQVPYCEIRLEQRGKYLSVPAPEDAIIIHACHFCYDLERSTNLPRFHGFLKYLTDLCRELAHGTPNWELLRNRARHVNASSQVYWYLKLGVKYLNAPVPPEVIARIREDGSRLQNMLLDRIDGMKILFNEPTFFSKLYSKIYLKGNFLNYLVIKAHALYNKMGHKT